MATEKRDLAILMLCCRDYEAAELALACHMAYGDPDVPIFALQNCRDDYDSERMYIGLKRYEALYPRTIRVIDNQAPGRPYRSIRTALASDALRGFQHVCKVDDDVFPIARGWLEALQRAWAESESRYGDQLAYVTPLLNNNNWGFPQTLKALGLEAEFLERFAKKDRRGSDTQAKAIVSGAYGPMIWGAAHIARWLHEETTFKPDRFIEATRALEPALVATEHRYSIGCMLFKPALWEVIDDGGDDDEIMLFNHCREEDRKIVCARSVPFVHLAYYPQREELRDIPRKAQEVYAPRLGLAHAISAKPSHAHELESRLRHLEWKMGMIGLAVGAKPEQVAGIDAPPPVPHDQPDDRFLNRPSDDLELEEEAARETDQWIKARLNGARRTDRPVDTLRAAVSLAPRGGLALEFGVGGGTTLRVIADARADGRVWGFDWFKGLPEEWRINFPVGAFSTPEIPSVPGAQLVVGLFQDTLPQFLVENPEPVDFVHVDCDLYSSTQYVLNQIEHRLRPGSVLSFDEYCNYPGWQQHEHRAWTEFIERTGRRFAYEVFTWGDEQVAVRLLQ